MFDTPLIYTFDRREFVRCTSMNRFGQQPKNQFGIRHLLLLTSCAALSLVPAAYWGLPALALSVGILVIGALAYYRQFVFAFLALLLMVWLLMPAVNAPRVARRPACLNHMRMIALAILNYESAHGHLPPPYSTDDEGRPLHSWRVLILPYMEEVALYEAIDLTKPWDDPVNLALASQMPSYYQCPDFQPNSPADEFTTPYVAVIGDNTAWPRSGGRKMSDIVDGASRTLAVLESEKYRLHWMSTADPDIEMITDAVELLSNGTHQGGQTYSCLDGFTGFLAWDITLADLLALISIDRRNQPLKE